MRRDFIYLGLGVLFLTFVHELLARVLHQIQLRWEAAFQQSGHLSYWWLITASFVILEGVLLLAVAVMFMRRSTIRVIVKAPIISLSIDYGMMIALWAASAIFRDPLLQTSLASVGLQSLSAFF